MRSRVNFTAAPLNGVPSWNLTPFLRLNVYVVASGEIVPLFGQAGHELARLRLPDERLAHVERDADGRIEIGDLWIERIVEIAVESIHQAAAESRRGGGGHWSA